MVSKIGQRAIEDGSITDSKISVDQSTYDPEPTVGYDANVVPQHAIASIQDKRVELSVHISGDISGTPSQITFKLPIQADPSVLGEQIIPSWISEDDGATWVCGIAKITNTDDCVVEKQSGTAFISATGTRIVCNGTYKAI